MRFVDGVSTECVQLGVLFNELPKNNGQSRIFGALEARAAKNVLQQARAMLEYLELFEISIVMVVLRFCASS